LAAIRFAAVNTEMVMANLLLKAAPEDRERILKCFLEKITAFMETVKGCTKDTGGGGGDGPDCPKDSIPVGDFCVPAPGGGGGNE
jgi:hypothetical protein